MASPTEELNRLNRAIPIVFALIAARIPSVDASKSEDGDWTLAAQLAGMQDYTPSLETRRVIINLLMDFEEMQAKLKAHLPRPIASAEAQYLAWAAKATEPK